MTERDALKEVILDGIRCSILNPDGAVNFSDLVRFQQKVLFGDPSKDDNDLLSAWQMSDHSGGSGVYELKEGTDTNRFFFGTTSTRFPGAMTKPPFVGDNSAGSIEGSGNKHVLGEMWSDSIGDFIVIYTAGSGVRRGLVNGADVTHRFTVTGVDEVCNTLANGVPVGPGCAFQGQHSEEVFFIPQGNNGYAMLIDTGTTLTEDTNYKFVSFTVWDNKLLGITTGGRLYYCTDPDFGGAGPDWTLYDVTYALSKSYRIRKLINFFDRRDEPCVYILTDRDIWQFDPDGPELFRIDFGWPSHKYHGNAACVWNGQLFVATGMSVFRYTGATWMPVGLDRDDGMPSEYHGHIVELVAGMNAIYALVQGDATDSDYGSKSSIHEFTGTGWHCIWTDDTAVPSTIQYHGTLATTATTVTGMVLTQSGISTATAPISTLVFSTAGTDDHVYCMALGATMANPRVEIRHGQLYGSGMYYYFETGEFDADMMGYIKIGNAVQFYLEEPRSIGTPSKRDTFKVLYRVDRGSWVELASTFAVPGRYSYPMGDTITGTAFKQGVSFERIQFRFEIHRAGSYDADKPMMLTNVVFSFLKTVSSNDAFMLAIDTKNGSNDGTYGPIEFQDFLDGLTSIKRFTSLVVAGVPYRVYVSQNKGTRHTGDAQLGIREMSIVEIPTGLSS